MLKSFLLAATLYGSIAFTHPQKITSISGKGIHLQSIDHSFAGSINNRIVSGFKKPGQFESELSILENDQKTIATFKRSDSKPFGGKLVLNKKTHKNIKLNLLSLSEKENRFVFRFDNEVYNIYVTADDFKQGHYINPTYSMQFEGETISFKLQVVKHAMAIRFTSSL